jgi:hypothetical protein
MTTRLMLSALAALSTTLYSSLDGTLGSSTRSFLGLGLLALGGHAGKLGSETVWTAEDELRLAHAG